MKHAKAVRRIIFTVLIVAAVIVGFNTYTADYYHAKDYELQTTEVSETDAYIAYGDPQSETGLIFYPGAKVEETAYAPVMDGLAQQGIFCVTVKMPAHLAILKPNAADEVRQEFGEVKRAEPWRAAMRQSMSQSSRDLFFWRRTRPGNFRRFRCSRSTGARTAF